MSGRFLCDIGLHAWGKWSEPKTFKIIRAGHIWGPLGTAQAQERTCKKCNRVEHRWVD